MAAMDFPSSPTNGQVANGYTYDSTKGAWRKNASITVSVTTSSVAPANPNPGDQWLYTNEGTLFTWWNDGTSSQWVQSSSVIANADPNPMPAGSIMAWGTNTAPQNWLLCDGTAVSRSTYASLFAAIGTTYGTGDGSTTFNLPNMKGKTIVGRDSADTNFDALNTPSVYVGAKTHTLTASQIPAHSHPNTLSSNTVASSTHTHGSSALLGGAYVGYWATRTSVNWTATNTGGFTAPGGNTTNSNQGLAIFGSTDAPSATTTVGITNANNTGGDGAHNNLQPYIVLNYIIKASGGTTPGDSILTTRVGTLETSVRSVPLGGTGATTLTSGGYLKGAGTSAVTTQAGIPAGDITSGTLGIARGGTGATTLTSGSYLKGAGTSAITSQTGIPATDITSGALDIARGGTASTTGAGLVPIIPTTVSNTGGTSSYSATTGKVTLTGASTALLIDGIFSSTYTNYRVVFNPTSGGDYLYLRSVNAGVVNSTAGAYAWQMLGVQQGVIYYGSTYFSTSDTGMKTSALSTTNASFSFDVMSPYISTSSTRVHGQGNWAVNQPTIWNFMGNMQAASTTTGLQIFPATGTFSGTLSIYGYRD